MGNYKSTKRICLQCQSYAVNCHPGCDKSACICVSYTFKLPKRGSKVWKEIAALLCPEIEKGAIYSRIFNKGSAYNTEHLNHKERLKYLLNNPENACLK